MMSRKLAFYVSAEFTTHMTQLVCVRYIYIWEEVDWLQKEYKIKTWEISSQFN